METFTSQLPDRVHSALQSRAVISNIEKAPLAVQSPRTPVARAIITLLYFYLRSSTPG